IDAAGGVYGGHLVDQGSPTARELLELHRRAAAALDLADAVTHMEVFVTAEGPLIGEIAVRPGGLGIARMLQRACGLDLWEEFVRAALGEPPAVPGGPLRPPVLGWSQIPDVPGLRERLGELPGFAEIADPVDRPYSEVHFTAADEEDAQRTWERLRRLAAAER